MRIIGISMLMALATGLSAQPVLTPSIGLTGLPSDSAPVCTLPVQTPPMEDVGLFPGVSAADFQLYDLNGEAFHLETALNSGKPVLMIAGSYTCPVFRNKLPLIEEIQQTYGDQLTTIIIYTAEAHPYLDISPYFGTVNTSAANIDAGILYMQPTTYGERKAVAQDMLDSLTIPVPMLIDGPCNAWWDHYGPAPNIAYLIATDGTIAARHTWLNRHPQDMICDIDELLEIPNDCAEILGGTFTMEWVTNDTVFGEAGYTITVSSRILNNSDLPVLVEVHRLENNMPEGWSSSLCLDVCYQTHVDYTEIIVPAGEQQDFHYYFYTNDVLAHGHARVGLRNAEQFSNGFMMNLHGFSTTPTSIAEHPIGDLQLWPNPSLGLVHVPEDLGHDRITVRDLHGRIVHSAGAVKTLDMHSLAQGIYVVQAWKGDRPLNLPVRIQLL